MGLSSEVRGEADIIFPFPTFSLKAEESTCYFPRQRHLGLLGGILWNGGGQKRATACMPRANAFGMFFVLRKPRAKPNFFHKFLSKELSDLKADTHIYQ